MAESKEELKSLLMKVKEENEKAEDHGIRSHHFMANRWETIGTVTDFIILAPKSLWMVTAATKLKDACTLEEKILEI